MSIFNSMLSGSSIWLYLFIFFGKLIEVTLASLRAQLIHKGERLPGAIVAIFEYSIWLMITASVLINFRDDVIKLILLVLAFSLGHVLGSIVEEKIAYGFSTLTCFFIDKDEAHLAADRLRAKGFALTIIPAEGIDGAERITLVISVQRKHVLLVKKILLEIDDKIVITIQSIQSISSNSLRDIIK